jgi:hypothetical protein
MTDSDNPATGNAGSAPAPSSFTQDQGMEKLAALFAAETPQATIPEDKDQETPEADEAEGGDETPDDAPDEAEGTEQTETEDETEANAIELADETEIDLGDGERITFAELKAAKKQVKEFQRDYSRKTEELAENRKVVEKSAQAVVTNAQQLQQEREAFLAVAGEFIGQPPERPHASPAEDPIAWLEFQAAKENYEERLGKVRGVYQQAEAHKAKQAEEQQARMPEIIEAERTKLFERFPRLKDPEIARKTKTEMVETFQREYGLSPEEVANVADSRVVAVMLDALEYRKLKAAAPAAKAKVESKPPLVKAAKRQNPQSQAEREKQTLRNRHRQTGRIDDAVAILKSWNL